MTEDPSPSPDNEFHRRLQGKFSGILRWEQLDALWEKVLVRPQGWYVYEVDNTLSEHTVSSQELSDIVSEIDRVLHEQHKYDYCGIVYADDPTSPNLIKIYDPGNLGVVCGPGDAPILPRWILSRIKPQVLKTITTRQVWWKRILSSKND
uniref:Uncharacterized protein n=1 Tax=Candidatus Kentrum sp. MB TaxID=2138164 RepID=A0A450XHR9_9GAMM|nr:MAG: hypothetical protein BECKMB1821G_GA0114241_10425 [Candidatus Kentron sp. MB]VFK33970.1 MAG: hypothetical protein BECKMB1821I_GA0114274_105716 [Candidatus Kentron sp. MB]VFK76532.1 MAG: hypothetical protein BECKMB1821H_GA0114242_106115 [Candidatus Kentron sp. MB]